LSNLKNYYKFNKIIESTNIILQIPNEFANPGIVAKSRKVFANPKTIFCKSKKIFRKSEKKIVILAPAVSQRQSLFHHFAASKMAELGVSCSTRVDLK